jgi:hypothetical protein
MMEKKYFFLGILLSGLLGGCGLYVPLKSEFKSEAPDTPNPTYSQQGAYENLIVSHIACEIAIGLAQAQTFELPWLSEWGTSVTLTITAEDQGGISPGVVLIDPLRNVVKTFPAAEGGNVTSPQSFSVGFGASAAATATRTETIQFTYLNSDLLTLAHNYPSCSFFRTGTMIDGDLEIRQFIFDKAMIAKYGNASLFDQRSVGFKKLPTKKKPLHPWQWPVFNTFTEEIEFLAAYGGNVTPTWKLATITANSSSSLLAAERTYTNDLIITIGPLKGVPSETAPISLSTDAQNQHNARVQANAIATSIQSQTH